MRYRQESKYYVDYYEVPNQDACPDKHVKCCKGYVLVAKDNCLSKLALSNNVTSSETHRLYPLVFNGAFTSK
jgi:hypothetical protein